MKNIPEIRIKGFEGEWKESVLQENLADNLRTNTLARAFLSDNDGEVLNVHYGDVLIKYDSLLNAAKDDIPHIKGSKAKDYSDFIQDGDIIFADTAEDETAGKCVEVINVGNNNIVSGLHTIACRPKHTFGKGFLGYYINSPKYHEQLYPLLQGIKVFSLNKSQLEQTEMRTPESLAEQQSLGSFFSSFDRLLSDHHRRLENLRRVKKSMLQKMFPQQGQTVPEIRFKGFGGEWEKLLLGDLLDDNIKTNTFSRALLSDGNGEVLDIHYGDILIKFDSVLNVADVKIPHITGSKAKDFNCYLQDGDIIFADTAEDETAGKCIEIENIGNKYLVSGLHTIACRPNKVIGKGFLGYYLNSPNYHNQLLPLMQGIKVFSINKMPLKQTFVQLPSSVDEQRRIGSFFTSLANLINDEVNYIDQLTRVKSTLLQKMFV